MRQEGLRDRLDYQIFYAKLSEIFSHILTLQNYFEYSD